MVQILNYNEQFYLMTMDNSKFIDYKQFFKSFYKLPNSDNINRKHILYLSYWMEKYGPQNQVSYGIGSDQKTTLSF